jgi:hypothetical protein
LVPATVKVSDAPPPLPQKPIETFNPGVAHPAPLFVNALG